jgi:hypothetical protein
MTDHEGATVNGHVIDSGWVQSLETLIPTPAEYRSESVDRAQALHMLRCDDATLTELQERGLPHAGEPGAERFDRYDLFNLAFYSRSDRSLPELGFQWVMRFANGSADSWISPKRWRFAAEISCQRADGCDEAPWWRFYRPAPEHFGGHADGWLVEPSAPADPEGSFVFAGPADRFRLSATIQTRGEARHVRSQRLRRLFDEMIHGHRGLRFQFGPDEMQSDPDAVVASGMIDCVTASIILARECRDAGYEARAAKGYLLGLLGADHGWLEVRDDDGEMKVLDCTLGLLTAHVPASNPEFVEFCCGSSSNRVLPVDCPADAPVAEHRCGTGVAPATTTVTVRLADKET